MLVNNELEDECIWTHDTTDLKQVSDDVYICLRATSNNPYFTCECLYEKEVKDGNDLFVLIVNTDEIFKYYEIVKRKGIVNCNV